MQTINVRMKYVLTLLLYLLSGEICNSMQNLDCDLGLKDDNLCPIDGGWTSWSSWGLCSGKCGFKKSKRTRHRICNNPSPSNDGAPCIGPAYQIENCQIIGCTMKDYEEAVSNHPTRKKEMEIVKEIHKRLPALIELCFFVDCTFFIVEKILGNSAMLYWNAMNCVKYNVGCPRPGGWSTWEAWSPCTAICGRGEKYRTRNCNSPVPSNSELTCNNSAFEVTSCMGFNCKKYPTGTWINWSEWSVCSVECGNGIQIRKRSCSEIQNLQGSSCKGSTKEVKGCSINECSINGMWSSWTVWTPCTSSCGIGTQLRNRMCNNPSPSGNGTSCSGSASEVRQCFSKPCLVRSHEVAYFTEKSSLLYDINGKYSRLFHLYLRFLPLSSFGTIIDRFENNCKGSMCDFVKLFLHNGKLVLLSKISGCTLGLVHEHKLEIGQWHVVLIAIYGTRSMLRVNDGRHEIASFSCIPVSYNLDHAMKVGGFHGQLQEIAINFVPIQFHALKDKYDQKHTNTPFSSNNVQYLMGDDEEGFLHIGLTDSVAVPSPKNMEFWQIALVIKTEDINGIVAIIPDSFLNKCILLLLDEGRVKLKFHHGVNHVATESTEHILIREWFEIVLVQDGKSLYMQMNGNEKKYVPAMSEKMIITISASTVFLGAIRDEMREKICPSCTEIPQMSFILASLNIDGNQIDLLSLPVFGTTSKRFSSRTISISDYYEEVPLLLGQELKLSCFYNKIPYEKGHVYSRKIYVVWLLMDKLLESYDESNDFFHLKDDGRVSTISIASYSSREAIENFYSCHSYRRSKSNKTSSQIFFTFGITVRDKNEEFATVFWKEWNFIYETTIVCFILMIIWCLLEIFQDVKNGYGFYRLPKTPNNDFTSIINFVSSKSGVTLLGGEQAANEIVSKITENN